MDRKIVLLIIFMVTLNTARANNCEALLEGKAEPSYDDVCFLTGLGAGLFKKEYEENQSSRVLPFFLMAAGLFYWNNEEIGLYFMGNESGQGYWRTALTLAYVDEGFKKPESEPQLKGLEKLDAIVETGLKFSVGGPPGDIGIHISKDVSGEYNGIRVRSVYSYPMTFDNFSITPYAGLFYSDSDRANYYYGVSASNVNTVRPKYQLDATVSYSIGYDSFYKLGDNWLFFHSSGFKVLDEKISKSPLVVSDHPYFVSSGLLYVF